MDHRDPPPPPQSSELQLPSPVVPAAVRRRRSQRSPRQQAAIPVVVPPPAALPVPTSAPRQIPAPPAAVGRSPDADADYYYLMLLAHAAVSQADAEALEASSRPAPAAPVGKKRLRYSRPLARTSAADEEKEKAEPYEAPPLPPLAVVDEYQSSSLSSSNSDQLQHGGGVAVASRAAGAGASPTPMQLDGDDEEELEPGEIPPEKQPAAAGYNANAADEISAEDEKRNREVFVGGLSRDAMEGDVRAALSAAGEITQVRMFPDRMTGKNKGYCFVAYRDAGMASRAVAEFGDVKICGKQCRLAVPEGDEKTKIAQRDPTIEYYNGIYEQRQPSPSLAAQSSYITSWDHHASYVAPPVVAGYYYYPMYHNGNIVYRPPPADLNHHGLLGAGPSGRSQMGQSGSSRPAGQPHRNRN